MSEEQSRQVPVSQLDMGMLLTDPVWGSSHVSEELRERLTKIYYKNRGKGESDETVEMSLWGLLGSYTRDMRLGNISNDELSYCQYHIDLANHFLQEGHVKPFLIALAYSATMLELSQSKRGFLRKLFNTFTERRENITEEPKKRRLAGGGE